MKRTAVCIGLFLILASTSGCNSGVSQQQMARLEAQIQALNSSLASIQQELAAANKALADAQAQIKLLQQQLQEASKNTTLAPSATEVYLDPWLLPLPPWLRGSIDVPPVPVPPGTMPPTIVPVAPLN